MIHYTVVLWRRPGLTVHDFEAEWCGIHRQLALQLPGILAAEFRVTLRDRPQDESTPDGVGWLTFESREALDAALASPVAAQLREHTGKFADAARTVRAVVGTGTALDAGR